jgi:large subunit ribosomal protein L6
MSRIGKSPVAIAEGVSVVIENNTVTVKGKLGELSQELSPKHHCQRGRR